MKAVNDFTAVFFTYEEFIHERKAQQKRNINYKHYLQYTQMILLDNKSIQAQ